MKRWVKDTRLRRLSRDTLDSVRVARVGTISIVCK